MDLASIGQSVPRKPWIAVVLSIIMPGLGHVYCGRLRRGLLIWLAILTAVVGSIVGIWMWGVFMFKPLVVLMLGYVNVVYVVSRQAYRQASQLSENYVLHGCNRVHWYVVVLLAVGIAPLETFRVLVVDQVFATATIDDDNSYPNVLAGDRVYFEKLGPGSSLRRGELVGVELPRGQVTLLRVTGLPGDEVEMNRDTIIVNGKPLGRQPLGTVQFTLLDPKQENEKLLAFREHGHQGYSYDVFYSGFVDEFELGPIRLPVEQYFLVSDNRNATSVDSRAHGPFRRERIVGRPLYVWYSERNGGTRWWRIGLRLL